MLFGRILSNNLSCIIKWYVQIIFSMLNDSNHCSEKWSRNIYRIDNTSYLICFFLDIIQYIWAILCKWKTITSDKVSYFKYLECDLLLLWIMFYFLSDYFYKNLHNGQKYDIACTFARRHIIAISYILLPKSRQR